MNKAVSVAAAQEETAMQVGSGATIRGDLADALKENMYGEGEFIGLEGMPIFETDQKSATFAKVAFGEQPTKAVLKRAPGAGYSRQTREATTDTYTCEEYGREELVDDGEAANLARYFEAEVDAAQSATGVLRGEQESRIAAILFDTSSAFASYSTDGSDWSTAASGTPIKDVRAALRALKKQVNGVIAGAEIVALCDDLILDYALLTTEVNNRLMYAMQGLIDRNAARAALARAMGLDAIYSSSIQWNGAALWTQTKFGIYIRTKSRSMQSVPQAGRSFLWTADCPQNALVESYRAESNRSEVVRVRQFVDEKLITARAGHVLYGLTS